MLVNGFCLSMDKVAVDAREFAQGSDLYLYDAAFIDPPAQTFFDIEHWRNSDALVSVAQGRAAAVIFRYQDQQFVLRHYRRGGLVAKISEDKYRWSGLEQTRAWCEWHLLKDMYAEGLPVPRPVAARVRRKGLFYTADLVTLCLPNVTPLADLLMSQPLDESVWREIGKIIKRFHDAGIYHADLNARNILLDDAGKVYVIDFDKGERRAANSVWQRANIERLERSFIKFKNNSPQFFFDDQAMKALLDAYENL